jgi:hypothetical protein
VAPDPDHLACATIDRRVCAGSVLEVRGDGFGRWRGAEPGEEAEGALSFGAEIRITVCADDVVLPVAVADPRRRAPAPQLVG